MSTNERALSPIESTVVAEELPSPFPDPESPATLHSTLGEPLTIHQVAALLGCSPWTVRQRYVPQGLPHLRASARGKLVFFNHQVVAWIEKQQRQKGGLSR